MADRRLDFMQLRHVCNGSDCSRLASVATPHGTSFAAPCPTSHGTRSQCMVWLWPRSSWRPAMLLPRVVRYFSLVGVCAFLGSTVLFRNAPPVSAQNPPPPAPAFLNYFAPEDCSATHTPPNCIQPSLGSTTAGGHGAGEPSIGVDWSSGEALIEAGNHTLRVTFNDAVNPKTSAHRSRA
jgi:hypothetical protein